MLLPVCLAAALLAPMPIDDDPSESPGDGEMDWTGVLDEASFAALHELTKDVAPALSGGDVEIDGMTAYLSSPEHGDPIGAVIVIHEWWGLNDHVKHWADRLASDGYVALAVDLYGGTVATTRDEAMAAMRAVDESAATAKLLAAHAFLVDEDGPVKAERTASIGWCFGGGWSLKLATVEPDLDAAIVYYGRLITDVDALKGIACPVLGVFGNEDSGIPPAAVDDFAAAMKSAGRDLQLARYDADHAFANPSSGRYDAEHATAAWRTSRAFLCEKLWPEQPTGGFADRSRTMGITELDGWKATEAGGMRLASVQIDAETECYIVALRGNGGGLAPNLNRWRMQMGKSELSEAEIADLPLVPMFGRLAPMIQIDGKSAPMQGKQIEDALLLGAVAELDGETVFVKLVGPRTRVEKELTKFTAFCRSLR